MTCAMDEASAIVYVVNYATIWRMKLAARNSTAAGYMLDSGQRHVPDDSRWDRCVRFICCSITKKGDRGGPHLLTRSQKAEDAIPHASWREYLPFGRLHC